MSWVLARDPQLRKAAANQITALRHISEAVGVKSFERATTELRADLNTPALPEALKTTERKLQIAEQRVTTLEASLTRQQNLDIPAGCAAANHSYKKVFMQCGAEREATLGELYSIANYQVVLTVFEGGLALDARHIVAVPIKASWPRDVLSSDHVQTPINAHAFNVSAVTPGLNSTAFVRAKGSFLMKKKKKKSSPCGPYFLGTFQTLVVVRKPTTSHGSRNGQTLSQKGPSHIPHLFQNLWTNQIGHHPQRPRHKQMTCVTRTHNLRTQTSTFISAFQTFLRLRQCCNWTLEVSFPQFQSSFKVFLECLSDDSGHKIRRVCPLPLSSSKGLLPFDCHQAL